MRMRKKKHLDERLEDVKNILYISKCEDRNFNTAINVKDYLDIEKWFESANPLYLEIGCGKGKFAAEYAKSHPEINFLAVEKDPNVIVSACERAKAENIKNLRFLECPAEYLERHLKENSADMIFLNFSCPFPKNKYASHRLTSPRFLNIYKNLLKKNGEIHQKTDNMNFFEYSLEQFSNQGYQLKNISLDLHNSEFENNIETEYEAKFTALGQPIYRLEAFIKEDENG